MGVHESRVKPSGNGNGTANSQADQGSSAKDLGIRRRLTQPGQDPLDAVTYEQRRSVITNPDGSVVFEMKAVEVPTAWSQLATDIVVSKYFRKAGLPNDPGHETSARQVVHRVAHTLREAGEDLGGYFADAAEADTFEAELSHLLINQMGAFNSPVWFNCGLAARYGIRGRSVGTWAVDPATGVASECPDSYSRPQLSACFIQSIEDDLLDIAEAVKREMRLFKFGSGTGTNFSSIRGEGEQLSGGGTSSGLMSFLEVLDKAAGATKSGGTTRRAAKMVMLDMDHPEIERFILWKAREEDKAQALIEAGYDGDFNGEVYRTVSGQNSNNSVRVSNEFMEAVESDRQWQTRARTTGEVAGTHQARELMDKIAYAAWRCADPGVQYDTTINHWHTCPNTAPIRGSNPCSEYMFLDDSACNLASLNLMKFRRPDGSFDIETYRHAVRIFFIAQEIVVDFASYPTELIAKNSHDYRPLGLGYANLGTLLMVMGLPYDSEEARTVAGAITAVTTGHAYATSARMAARKGAFNGHAANAEPMLRVMRQHRDASHRLTTRYGHEDLVAAAREDWERAVALGAEHGYRNAQATVLAPTGTIGLLMDCDTTGVEPEFALVKFKKLAGGGYFKIINQSVPTALASLGYSETQVEDIINWILGHRSLNAAPGGFDRAALLKRGFTSEDLAAVEGSLSGVFDLRSAFATHVLGADCAQRLGIPAESWSKPGFDLLKHLGFSDAAIAEAERHVCGTQTIEGAPHIAEEHLAVFDCANRCGPTGERFIHHSGHIKMMAAVQPCISGAISKTINMPSEVSQADIREAYFDSWRLGLKAVALYRDGCKASQPLSSGTKKDAEEEVAPKTLSETASVVSESAGAKDAAEALSEAALWGPQRRRRLPKKRFGFTEEARVGGQKVYLRTGNYEDGSLGEIFIDMHKEGAAFRSMMNCFAISVSLGLQHGVPLKSFVDAFTFTRFDPQGSVDHPNIRWSTSVIDFVFRLLAMEYLGRRDFVHVPPADGPDQGMAEAEETIAKEADAKPDPLAELAQLSAATNPASADALVSDRVNAELGVDLGAERGGSLSDHLSEMMGDAPFCETCGHITVRNGACYKCMNCGHSMGCS